MPQTVAPVSPKVPIQVVFQGGGAKLCALMAVCEVLQRYHDTEKIEIKRVAGSSAGAIAAVMLGSRLPLQSLKDRVKLIGPAYLSKMKVSRPVGAWRVMNGSPYFSGLKLENVFNELFCTQTKLKTLRDLHFEPQLYFTDLYSLAARSCDTDDPIPVALAKSCRFPFAFSGYASEDYGVDGGLAMNLPVDKLKSEEVDMGSVIGIGFEEKFTDQRDKSLLTYTQQLFSAAVQSGVTRSEMILGSRNLFRIDTEIATFEFEKCLGEGLRIHYELVAQRFEKWLDTWLLPYRATDRRLAMTRLIHPAVTTTPWHRAVIRELDDGMRADPCVHAVQSCTYDTAVLSDDGSFSGNYRSRAMMRFRIARKTRLLQFTFQIGKRGSFDEANLGCGVTDSDGRSLSFVPHVEDLGELDDSVRTYRVFFLFDEPLTPETPGQPFSLEYEYEADDPYPKLGVKPECSTVTQWQGGADEVRVSVAFPRCKFRSPPRHSDVAALSKDKLDSIGFGPETCSEFVPSEPLMVDEFMWYLNLSRQPDDYVLVGRVAKNVKQGQTIGIVVE